MINTDSGVVRGTAQYMSPEQACGLKVDALSDVWSLGCVLYETLTGRPFDGPTPGDVVVSILEREPRPHSRYAGDMPPKLDWISKEGPRAQFEFGSKK